jgi:hypothetical protein
VDGEQWLKISQERLVIRKCNSNVQSKVWTGLEIKFLIFDNNANLRVDR